VFDDPKMFVHERKISVHERQSRGTGDDWNGKHEVKQKVTWPGIFEKKADVTSRISSRPLRIAKRRACSKHVRLFQAGLCGYGVGCGDGLGHSDQ
jgi:hypothetical protein